MTTKYNWVTTNNGDTLHRVNDYDRWPWMYMNGDDRFSKDVMTACGRDMLAVVPGLLTRMDMPRCKACCRAVGCAQGVGAEE